MSTRRLGIYLVAAGVTIAAGVGSQSHNPCYSALQVHCHGHAEVAHSTALQNAKACTYEVWFMAHGPSGRILSKGDGLRPDSNRTFDLSYTGQKILAEWFLTSGTTRLHVALQGPSVPPRSWTHVASTFDSAARQLAL